MGCNCMMRTLLTATSVFEILLDNGVFLLFNFYCQYAFAIITYTGIIIIALNRLLAVFHPLQYSKVFSLELTFYYLILQYVIAFGVPIFILFGQTTVTKVGNQTIATANDLSKVIWWSIAGILVFCMLISIIVNLLTVCTLRRSSFKKASKVETRLLIVSIITTAVYTNVALFQIFAGFALVFGTLGLIQVANSLTVAVRDLANCVDCLSILWLCTDLQKWIRKVKYVKDRPKATVLSVTQRE
ncbi:unnamed protein product, partial [Mesorhabditis belari]|uniref:Serpentine receptor class gamma n=1 Tax=Mesorhabditis belari TaxID=2138241 RepID=A0AAF3EZ16_9BILA